MKRNREKRMRRGGEGRNGQDARKKKGREKEIK